MMVSNNSLERQSRELRAREELAFRRRVLRGALLVALLAAALFAVVVYRTRTGTVMAESRNVKIGGQPTIKIREFGSFLDDNPQYRFEYYCYSYPGIWSCQSYVGQSYRGESAEIEWDSDGTATVYLDHSPRFTCKDGTWTIHH